MEQQAVAFRMAEELYGLAINQVREIIRFASVTKIPKAPDFVLGVINLRGNVVPIISLRKWFGLSDEVADDATRIVVTDACGRTAGLVVDAVTEVLRIPERDIETVPSATSTVDSQFITGVGKVGERLIIMLDPARMLDDSVLADLGREEKGELL